MLVIRRRGGESLWLGEDIEVEVLAIEGSQVKLGVRAPREIVILRSEVKAQGEINRESAQTALSPAVDLLVRRLRRE